MRRSCWIPESIAQLGRGDQQAGGLENGSLHGAGSLRGMAEARWSIVGLCAVGTRLSVAYFSLINKVSKIHFPLLRDSPNSLSQLR